MKNGGETIIHTFPNALEAVQIRQSALNDAIRSSGMNLGLEEILRRADAFHSFMMNGARKPRVRRKTKRRVRKVAKRK